MILEIDTFDKGLAFTLFNSHTVGPGTKVDIPGGATAEADWITVRKALDFPETVRLVVSFGSGVVSSVVANWLWSKLAGRVSKIRINHREVEFEEGQVKRMIEEQIEIERR